MNMKKIIILILTALTVFAAVSCGNNEKETQGGLIISIESDGTETETEKPLFPSDFTEAESVIGINVEDIAASAYYVTGRTDLPEGVEWGPGDVICLFFASEVDDETYKSYVAGIFESLRATADDGIIRGADGEGDIDASAFDGKALNGIITVGGTEYAVYIGGHEAKDFEGVYYRDHLAIRRIPALG